MLIDITGSDTDTYCCVHYFLTVLTLGLGLLNVPKEPFFGNSLGFGVVVLLSDIAK